MNGRLRDWSLRTRLIVAFTGLIVLGFAGLALLAGRQISTTAVADYNSNLLTQATLVARGLKEALEHMDEGASSRADVAALITDFANQSDTRVTLIDNRGQAWLDSSEQLPPENQTNFPEVAAAFSNQMLIDIHTDDRGELVAAVAAPVIDDGRILSVVRLSRPVTAARTLVAQRWLTLGSGVALLALLAVLLAIGLAASLIRPLNQLQQSVTAVAQGNLEQRLPEDRRDEIGELARAFNHMTTQVQSMLEEQRAFASNASHELRTPLTTIRLRSEALRDGTLDAATTQQYIREIDDEAQRMGELANDLLLLSRFDAGRAEMGQALIDPLRLAQRVVQMAESHAAARQINLTLDAAAPLPPLRTSLNHVQVVWRNVLDNALKYTPAGGQVTWRLWAEGDLLWSEVRDTGQGIAPDVLPHLFKRFYRGDKARTRTVAGTGLGLALTRAIVQAYNGRITIDSLGVGQGTTVLVQWPLAQIDN